MASRSLMDNALINTAKVTHLKADVLTVTNSDIPPSSSSSNSSTPEITRVNELIPEFVKGLNTITDTDNYLSQISIMMSNIQLSNAYISETGPYKSVGLYLLLKKIISSNSGPECPGIIHSEMFIQNELTLNSFVAADGANVIFTPVSPSFSYFDENLLSTLNLMDKSLAAERQLGLRPSGGVNIHSSFKNGELTIAQDSFISAQYINGSSFVVVKEELQKLALSTKASLLDVRSTYASDLNTYKSYTAKMQETIGATVTVTNSPTKSDGTTSDVKDKPYITPILNSLFSIHACTAIIGKLIADGNPPPIVNLTTGKVVSTGATVDGWTASEGANWSKLIAGGVITTEYYYIPELRDFLDEYIPCNDTFVPYYVNALVKDAQQKLKLEYSIDFPDNPTIYKAKKVVGYTVSVPLSSSAYNTLNKSFGQ